MRSPCFSGVHHRKNIWVTRIRPSLQGLWQGRQPSAAGQRWKMCDGSRIFWNFQGALMIHKASNSQSSRTEAVAGRAWKSTVWAELINSWFCPTLLGSHRFFFSSEIDILLYLSETQQLKRRSHIYIYIYPPAPLGATRLGGILFQSL